MEDIYEAKFVAELFDNMSGSYSRMNYITSFGFSERWRRQCVEELTIQKGAIVVDLMTGMGECWKYILKKDHAVKKLIALDFSKEMIKKANQNKLKYKKQQIEIREENVFKNGIKSESADYVISGFGLKTFNENQLKKLAFEIDRILMRNVKNIIPIFGKLLLGNPETYRMLGIYTETYKNSKSVLKIFKAQGFDVDYINYFYGCASGIKGVKK